MTFASLIIERPPLDWSGFVGALGQWLQDAGLYAFLWLGILWLSYLLVPEFRKRTPWGGWQTAWVRFAAAGGFGLAVFAFCLACPGGVVGVYARRSTDVPLVRDLWQRRVIARRIWAIARVSIKEAWSRGIVWVCVIIPLIYLYADWYISAKPEDQLRNRIGIAYFSMSILFVLSAGLLGSFSI